MLCHQDLHGGNLLRAEREPWLAIDSKPIVAEPAYDTVGARPGREADAHGRSAGDSTSSPSCSSSTASGCGCGGSIKSLGYGTTPKRRELFSEVGSS